MKSKTFTNEKKILLLGSTGMLGTVIEKVCRNRDINCTGITHKQLEITNLLELNEIIQRFMPTVVINTVAIPGIDQCELEPQKAFAVNSIAVLNLAKICEKNRITLMQISSSSVFDGTKNGFYTEKDEVNPTGVYSTSKYVSECFVKNICSKHYIIRLPMLFGRRRNKPARFVDKVIEKIKRDEEINVSIDRIDTPTYTLDAANIILYLIEKENFTSESPSATPRIPTRFACEYGLYHVSNSGKTNIYNFVKKLCELMESNSKIIKVKENDFKSIAYKPLKLALKSVKIEPLRKWEDALHEFVTKELK